MLQHNTLCSNCSKQQVMDAMKQLKELVHSELQKYAEELINEVASVSRELYVVNILN